MSDRDKLVEELLVGLAPLKFRIPTHAEALVRQAAQQIRKDGEEVDTLREELATMAEKRDTMQYRWDKAETLVEMLTAERDSLKAALEEIAWQGTDMPPAYNNESDWYRQIAWGMKGTAARALTPTEDKPKPQYQKSVEEYLGAFPPQPDKDECPECGGIEAVPVGTYPIKGGGVHQIMAPCPKCTNPKDCEECGGSGRIYYETGEFAGDQPITDWEPCPNKCNPIGEGGE